MKESFLVNVQGRGGRNRLHFEKQYKNLFHFGLFVLLHQTANIYRRLWGGGEESTLDLK